MREGLKRRKRDSRKMIGIKPPSDPGHGATFERLFSLGVSGNNGCLVALNDMSGGRTTVKGSCRLLRRGCLPRRLLRSVQGSK
jgi:hypothetical protein